MLCAKCCDHATGKTGIFNLSHLDSKHQKNYRPVPPGGYLTMVHEFIDHVPTRPPLAMVLEPTNEIYLNEITFTGAWCFPVSNTPVGITSVTHIPTPDEMDDTNVLSELSSGPHGPPIDHVDEIKRQRKHKDTLSQVCLPRS
jgi:hypothetical protein